MTDELEITVEIRRGLNQPWKFHMMVGPMTSAIAPSMHLQRQQFEYQFAEVMRAALDKLFTESEHAVQAQTNSPAPLPGTSAQAGRTPRTRL